MDLSIRPSCPTTSCQIFMRFRSSSEISINLPSPYWSALENLSRARRLANRQNALKSTGPRTGAGKRRASENALRHGLSQPIDVKQVGDALDRLQNVLIRAGYQPTHAFRVALCLLDYDRVERAEDELHHRMMCMASAYAMMEPRIPNSLAPLLLDNQRDIELGALHYIS